MRALAQPDSAVASAFDRPLARVDRGWSATEDSIRTALSALGMNPCGLNRAQTYWRHPSLQWAGASAETK